MLSFNTRFNSTVRGGPTEDRAEAQMPQGRGMNIRVPAYPEDSQTDPNQPEKPSDSQSTGPHSQTKAQRPEVDTGLL